MFGVCSELYTCFQKVVPTFPCRKHCQFSSRANKLPGPAILMSRTQALLQSRLSPPGLLKGSHFASELPWLWMHPADLHLLVKPAKNILKVPGLWFWPLFARCAFPWYIEWTHSLRLFGHTPLFSKTACSILAQLSRTSLNTESHWEHSTSKVPDSQLHCSKTDLLPLKGFVEKGI